MMASISGRSPGKRVRVRGWIEWRNGPMIEVSHAEQVEVLPSAPATGTAPAAPAETTDKSSGTAL
jgi:hypothetical protein